MSKKATASVGDEKIDKQVADAGLAPENGGSPAADQGEEPGEGQEDADAGNAGADADRAPENGDGAAMTGGVKESVADAVLANSPRLDVYYRTADGTAFYTGNAAKLHAAGLEDQTVQRITR